MKHKLAIDFGTTNSLLARWDEPTGKAQVVSIAGISTPTQDNRQQPLIPSLLYVQNGQTGQVSLGQAVLDGKFHQMRDNRLFRNFKRALLTRSSSEARLIDGVMWNEVDAGKRFLHGLLAAIPFAGNEIDQLIVTVPVVAFENYLTWLNEGLHGLAPEAVRVVDESTAAALGYAVMEPGALVLVFDFGGGSLDLSLVQLPESREKTGGFLNSLLGKSVRQHAARVIAKAGLTLGGSDIDQWLLGDLLQRNSIEIHDLGNDYAALLTACEQAKIELSSEEMVSIAFQVGKRTFNNSIQRDELEALLGQNGFYDSIRRVLDKIMHIAQRQGIFREDIQHVLMVGGASLMPSVQKTLQDYFYEKAVRVDRPFTAVVEGALQIAVGFGLEDYLVHSYGLRYLDPQTGKPRYDEIVAMGSSYPTKPVEVILEAAHPRQEQVEFVIGEITTDAVSTVEVQYEEGQAYFVAQAKPEGQVIIPLNHDNPLTVQLTPPGEPGTERLRARFWVDEQRHMQLNVYDLRRKKELLKDTPILHLGESQGKRDACVDLTGREPGLAPGYRPIGQQRLSLRNLGVMMNMLPAEAVSLEAAAEALRSKDFYARFEAADILARRGDRDARRILEDLLQNGEPPQRACIANHLYRFSWFVAEPLLRKACEDPDLRVREGAIYALCRLRGPNGYRMLIEILSQAEDNLRLAAAWGLGINPEPGCVPVLEVVMKAADPEARVKALEALGASQALEAVPVVVQALVDPDDEVRYAATLSWIELEGEACFARLAGTIIDCQGNQRRAYVRGLFHATNYLFIDIGKSQAAETVINALRVSMEDKMPAVRLIASMPLAWIRHPLAAETLQQAYLNEQDSEVKARMLYNAVDLMSDAAQSMMAQALTGTDSQTRMAAEYLANRGK